MLSITSTTWAITFASISLSVTKPETNGAATNTASFAKSRTTAKSSLLTTLSNNTLTIASFNWTALYAISWLLELPKSFWSFGKTWTVPWRYT